MTIRILVGLCCVAGGVFSFETASGQMPEVRSYTGENNNRRHPEWGSAGIAMLRKIPAAYPGDGSGVTIIGEPDRPSPRVISNLMATGSGDTPNRRRLTDFVWQWGQFLDHDIDLTAEDHEDGSISIFVTDPDDILAPIIPMTRSAALEGTGTAGTPREQVNLISAYIDASNVYGSDKESASALRTFEGGKLLSSAEGKLLPTGEDGHFLAGDVRANEQVGLTAMHTLFMREHNRLCDRIAEVNPTADDEEIYQTARRIVGAEMQIITYREFLPALLGWYAPSPRGGRSYRETVNPGINNEFATACYRFGHSMLSPNLLLVDETGSVTERLPLRNAFFDPGILTDNPGKLELVLRGLATQTTQEIDNQLVDDVRNFLFGEPGNGGLDLASLNIQRGRDHGLPDYNALRKAYGLRPARTFADINPNPAVASALKEAYGEIDKVDAWVGGLAEEHAHRGMSMGRLFAVVIRDQFERLRVGDRFYYTRDPGLKTRTVKRVIDLRRVSLSQVIRWNTTIDHLPRNVFLAAPEGSRSRDRRGDRNGR